MNACTGCKYDHIKVNGPPCNGCVYGWGSVAAPNLYEYEDPVYPKVTDTQVGGSHYQSPIQPVDFIVKNNIKWREANVIKYVFRHEKKNGVEDLKKARHYLDMLIEDYK